MYTYSTTATRMIFYISEHMTRSLSYLWLFVNFLCTLSNWQRFYLRDEQSRIQILDSIEAAKIQRRAANSLKRVTRKAYLQCARLIKLYWKIYYTGTLLVTV